MTEVVVLEGSPTASDQIRTVSTKPPECLVYIPNNSYAVSVGIDRAHPTDGPSTKSNHSYNGSGDAQHISRSLVDSKAIPEKNVAVLTSRDDCTRKGMQAAVKQQAEKVETSSPDGLFVCTYSGPVVEVGEGEWSMTPSDFNKDNPLTHVTAASLKHWISDTKVKQALFMLDCPFADKLATKLTTVDNSDTSGKVIVLSACSSSEGPCVIGTLGHSFFSYFAAQAFSNTSFVPGYLPLLQIYKGIRKPCKALSLLLVTYDPAKEELRQNIVNPKIKSKIVEKVELILPTEQGTDETDGEIGRFEFLTRHFKPQSATKVHDKVYAWLETIQEFPNGPLAQLHEQKILKNEILLTAVCSVVFSVASIQVALDKQSVSNPNFLIVAFLTAIATIEVHGEVEVSVEQFKRAWEFYHQVLVENGVHDEKVVDLFKAVVNDDAGIVIHTHGN